MFVRDERKDRKAKVKGVRGRRNLGQTKGGKIKKMAVRVSGDGRRRCWRWRWLGTRVRTNKPRFKELMTDGTKSEKGRKGGTGRW